MKLLTEPANGQHLQKSAARVLHDNDGLMPVNGVSSMAKAHLLSTVCLAHLADTPEQAVLVEDEAGKIVLVNQAFCDFFDIAQSPAKLVGTLRREMTNHLPDLFPRLKMELEPLSKAKLTETVRRADGRLLKREYVPVWQGEHWAGAFWVFREIIEHVVLSRSRKQAASPGPDLAALSRAAEPQLDELGGLVRQVIDSSPNVLYVKDGEGRLLLANEAFADLRGVPMAEIQAQSVLEEDFSLERDLEILRSGTSANFEEFYKTKSGRKVWFSTIKKVFVRPDGSSVLLSISSDITEMKRARHAAENSAKAKENFLANMSHEIRTPMNAILGMANLLRKSELNAQQRHYLQIMLASADHLLFMLNDILDFAKIESGKIDLESLPFDLNEAIRNGMNTLVAKADEKRLLLHFEAPSDPLPVVEGDSHRLNQILLNLIANAIKFTELGEVAVSAVVKGATDKKVYIDNRIDVEFCVRDTGIGIPREKQGKIFESFRQAYNNTTRKYGGTGLGLSICKSLVELQGGNIRVESTLGEGSRFYFTIPYKISEQQPATLRTDAFESADKLRGLWILLVEDNEVNQFLALSLLQSWGVQTDVAADGRRGVEKAMGRSYDLILMDIQMPVMNGIEATVKIRGDKNPNQATPIVALSANALKSDIDQHLQAGFNEYMTKPFEEAKLYALIARLTGRDTPDSPKELAEESRIKSVAAPEPPREVPVPAPPQQEAESPLYDLSDLGSLANDPVFVRKMLRLFADTVPGQLISLQEAVGSGRWEEVAKLAHALKSTYGNIGVRQAAATMKRIEAAAMEQQGLEHVADEVQSVKQLTEKVIAQALAELTVGV